MFVRYVGPARSVVIAATGQRAVRHGDPVDVGDDLGAQLVAQTRTWVAVDPAPDVVEDAPITTTPGRKAASRPQED